MKTPFSNSLIWFSASLLALAGTPSAQSADTTLKFSDSTKSGRLVVQVGMGDVTIVGDDLAEVRISGDTDTREISAPRDDGLRRLDGGGGFSAAEANNVITVTFANVLMGGRNRGGDDSDVTIAVPRQTNVTIERAGPGDMAVRDIAGDLEIRGAIGDIELDAISGGVVVESVNGDVAATFAALTTDRPVSINVVHGDVELHVPVSAKANVSLRTLRGEMLTNFSDTELKTNFNPNQDIDGEESSEDVSIEADHERAMADHERAVADRERAIADARKSRSGSHVVPPIPPIPPIPPLPPMAGGRLVAGTLNGGGTTVSVTTITGDITLRKVE